jgi:manganese oxidase
VGSVVSRLLSFLFLLLASSAGASSMTAMSGVSPSSAAGFSFPTLLMLGLVAGGTIFIGLPVGRMQRLKAGTRSVLSMVAAGILLFLLVEILGEASGQTSSALRLSTPTGWLHGLLLSVALVGGLFMGFVGLVAIEQRLIRKAKGQSAEQLSLMIALGIGVHNLSEGLAIGQTYAQGQTEISVGLLLGFALHNATEGFGIVGPSLCGKARLPWRTLLMLGVIGGGPTFIGTLLGSLWTNAAFNVFVLALAGGAILYVLKELFHSVRQSQSQYAVMTAVVAGFTLGWGTGAFASVVAGSGGVSPSSGTLTSADGDIISTRAVASLPSLTKEVLAAQNQAARGLLEETALKPQTILQGVHRYTLTARAFPWQITPTQTVMAWGYNDTVPGPLLRFTVGDKVEIVLKNRLPQATTLHWHGLAVPEAQDGVPGVTQSAVQPNSDFTYRFTVTPQMMGTHFYHSHVNDDFQMDSGLHGEIIVDPAPSSKRVEKGVQKNVKEVDALFEMASFKVAGSETENVFTFNGKAFPAAPALIVHQGDTLRLRLVNASAEESHVFHLHGYTFQIVAQDGNELKTPLEANTVLLGASQTADIRLVANNLGTWMAHCHIMDHTINPGPNAEGNATHIAEMGGLTSFIQVVKPETAIAHRTVSAGQFMTDMTGMTGQVMDTK